MAATRGDRQTEVPVSVAELCRRLGPVPATADSLETGATPLLVGDLLRREGRPAVPPPDPAFSAPVAEIPEARRGSSPAPVTNDDLAIPAPRRRGEACKTALGAGGLVVAGSVLGAALLAAAGIGGALPVPQGDDGTGQFHGEGTLRSPGTAYGSVTGRPVMSGARLVSAIGYYLPSIQGARTTALPSTTVGGAAGGSVVIPSAAPTVSTQASAPVGSVTPPNVITGAVTPVLGGASESVTTITDTVDPVVTGVAQTVTPVTDAVAQTVTPVVNAAAPVVTGVAQTVTPVVNAAVPVVSGATDTVVPVVGSVAQELGPIVGPVTAAVAPAVAGVTTVVQPVAEVVEPVVGSVAAPLVQAAEPLLEPALQVTAPVVEAVGPVSEPILTAATPLAQPVLTAVQPVVGPVLDAARPGLRAADPLLQPLQGLADPVATQVGTAAELSQVDPSALPTQVLPVVQSAADTATSTLQGTTTTATTGLRNAATDVGSAVQDAAGLGGTAADAPVALQVPEFQGAELPTMRLPIVAPHTSAVESTAPRVAEEPRTELLTIVPQATDLGRSIDPPTIPLPTVSPELRTTDAAQADGEPRDSAQQDSGRHSLRDDGADESAPTDTLEEGGAPLTGTLSSVTGDLFRR